MSPELKFAKTVVTSRFCRLACATFLGLAAGCGNQGESGIAPELQTPTITATQPILKTVPAQETSAPESSATAADSETPAAEEIQIVEKFYNQEQLLELYPALTEAEIADFLASAEIKPIVDNGVEVPLGIKIESDSEGSAWAILDAVSRGESVMVRLDLDGNGPVDFAATPVVFTNNGESKSGFVLSVLGTNSADIVFSFEGANSRGIYTLDQLNHYVGERGRQFRVRLLFEISDHGYDDFVTRGGVFEEQANLRQRFGVLFHELVDSILVPSGSSADFVPIMGLGQRFDVQGVGHP